ncbi:hypothetical protein [Ideonella sp. BN130291]|uniref:hypothetical protein n=1 Tax=Ideonella sp. BN130291 TaxID=3112940 RepID=UPI002E2590B5|nr:hypothetical protein [Ideonella sp. BN130291]
MRIDNIGGTTMHAVEDEPALDVRTGQADPAAAGQPQAQPEALAPMMVVDESGAAMAVLVEQDTAAARRLLATATVAEPAPAQVAGPQPATPVAQAIAAAYPGTTTNPATPLALQAVPPAANAPAMAASGYTGEPPVDAQWLAARETTLVAVRADYEAARAQAQASGGAGAGWVPALMITDESGQTHSASGAAAVFIPDPGAAPSIVGYDESGPVYGPPAGQWLEFNEEAFAATYRAQAGAPLQALAAQYGTDVPTLFAQHPDIWRVATADHALNAGPPPAGRAMGDAGQLGMLDLYMADPQVKALITTYGGTPAPAMDGIALEQVRIYGEQRYEQLSRLSNAMQSVRDQYTSAMGQAQAAGNGPGWVERARTVTVSDESGVQSTHTLYVTDESGQPLRDASGQPMAQTDRVFDPDAFTAWYEQQGGLQHEAFAAFYGASHSQFATDESGRNFASSISFDNPNWSMYGVGGGMQHRDLLGIDPNRPPELNDRNMVGFDLEAGWATPHGNIHQDRDWFETAVQMVIVGAVAYVSAGTLGPAAAGAMGLTTTTAAGATALTAAGVVVSAAVAGAATSVASGMLSGNLTLKGVLQGALAGGLTAGLMNGLGPIANEVGGAAGTIALRTTVQGGVQALLGGKFEDGALAGFAGGLADLASSNMQANIAEAVKNGSMTATQAASAKMFARVLGSAIRAAGNPDDPEHAFASAFLADTLQQLDPKPETRTAFDDEGNLMPGIVDPNASPEQQRAQLQAQLERQGFSTEQASALAAQEFDSRVAVTYPVGPGSGPVRPDSERNWDMTRRDDTGRIVERNVWQGDNKVLSYRSDVEGQYTLTAGPNHALVRGTDGQLQLVGADQIQAGAWTVVVPPGQTLVTNGAQALTLAGNADPRQLMLASTLVAPWTLAEGALVGEGALSGLGTWAARWAPTALRGAGALGLALYPTPLGGGETVVPFNENTRLVKPGSDVTDGYLEVRSESGEWLRLQDRQFNEYAVRDLLTTQRTSMLTPEELRQLTGPLINVAPPPAGPGVITTPPLSPEDRDLLDKPITTPIAPPSPAIIPGSPIEPQTIDELIITSRGFEPGTAEHKAATWDYYQERGGEWDYDRWSSTYDANQTRAAQANDAANRYRDMVGWGAREVTVQVELDGRTENRRLDIADPDLRKAIEYKTGYQTATADNLWELARDAELVKQGWSVQWVFRDRVSAPLEDALRRAGIDVKIGD